MQELRVQLRHKIETATSHTCLRVYREVQKNKKQVRNGIKEKWWGDAGCNENPWEDTWPTAKGQKKFPKINNIKAKSARCAKPEISKWGRESGLHAVAPEGRKAQRETGEVDSFLLLTRAGVNMYSMYLYSLWAARNETREESRRLVGRLLKGHPIRGPNLKNGTWEGRIKKPLSE